MKKSGILEGILFAVFMVCGSVYLYVAGTDGEYYNADRQYKKITGKKSFRYLENHPAFKEYKDYIIPWKDPLNKAVMPYLSLQSVCRVNHFGTESVVDGFNFMLRMDQEGKNRYCQFYDSNEIAVEQSKKDTGIVFIPGETNAPFALIVPGGGMTCICALAEGFPVAEKLHKYGYNIFLLKYRVSPRRNEESMEHIKKQQKFANEDFGNAVCYILKNSGQLGVNDQNYSVWGFSAGGQLCQIWGMDNEYGYKAYGLTSPTVSVLAYSGWTDDVREEEYITEPPTFLAYTIKDTVIGSENVKNIENYANILRKRGKAEESVFIKAKHGFGTGTGTDAEGWIEKAVEFWKNNS